MKQKAHTHTHTHNKIRDFCVGEYTQCCPIGETEFSLSWQGKVLTLSPLLLLSAKTSSDLYMCWSCSRPASSCVRPSCCV